MADRDALARIDALHTALTAIVLDGGDLGRIAATSADALGLGVLVTSTDGRERAAALSPALRTALDDAALLDPTGRVRVERITSGAPVGAGTARTFRVAAGGADLARLVAVTSSGAVADDDVRALERAAQVAALLITRQQAVTAVENKYRGDFLRDVFLHRAGGRAHVVAHAATLGWVLDRPAVVLVAQLQPEVDRDPDEESARQQREWQERFHAAWLQVCRDIDPSIALVDFSSEVVAVLPEVDGVRAGDLVRQAVLAVAGDKGGGRRPFTVGVSRSAADLGDLPAAYTQARRALDVGRSVHGAGSTTFFDDLGIHRLIAMIPESEELFDYVSDVLGPLAADTEEASDLRTTLQVLLDTNFNVAEAARTQFFHYNTMRYRVAKLERLLGPLSTDPHLRLDTAVGLRVLEVLRP